MVFQNQFKMKTTIFHYCDSNEINTAAFTILNEMAKLDWSTDQILDFILKDLKNRNLELTKSIEQTLGDVLKENLRSEDEAADKDFVALKGFIRANLNLRDVNKSKDAKDIWVMVKSHNLDLHNLSCERQLALSKSLLSNLNNETFKPKVENLIGVAERVEAYKLSTNILEVAYSKVIEINAQEIEVVAPSTLKKEVRKLINNQLLPHLKNAANAIPEVYQATYKVICQIVDEVNTKAHTRKTINSKTEPEESISE